MNKPPIPLEELIARALGLGRSTAARAHALCLGGTSHAAARANRAMAAHARGKGLDECEDASVDLLLGLFASDIARETTGTTIRFIETGNSEEDGVTWCEAPVLTERGQDLQALQAQFQAYVDLRNEVRERMLAESYLMRQLSR